MLLVEFEPFSTGDLIKIGLLCAALFVKCYFAGRMIGYGVANAADPKKIRIALSILIVAILAAGALLWIMVSPWLLAALTPIVAGLALGYVMGRRFARLDAMKGPTGDSEHAS